MSDGHGHNYGSLVLDGWAAVLPPPDWNPDLAQRIRTQLDLAEAYERAVK